MNIKNTIKHLVDKALEVELHIQKNSFGTFETSNIFLKNSLLRTNHLLNSINELIDDFYHNKYSIYILLRPLMSDYLLFNLIFQEIKKEKTDELRKEKLKSFSYDILLDGIERQYKEIKTVYSKREDINEILNGFVNLYIEFIVDSDNLDNLVFEKVINKNLDSANKIFNMIDNKNANIKKLYSNYNLLSKYDHFTFVSLKHLISKDANHESTLEEIINLISYNFRFLLLLVIIENEMPTINNYLNEIKIEEQK